MIQWVSLDERVIIAIICDTLLQCNGWNKSIVSVS